MLRSIRALSYPTFLAVWVGSLLSNIGTWMDNVSEGWVMTSQTHSALFVELLSFAQFVPILFFALPAGVMADRFDRKKVIVVAQTVMCINATVLAVLAYRGFLNPAILLTITFLQGSAWAFNGPSWQAVVPHLVPRKEIDSAIALNSMQYNLARLIGPAIAGIVVAAWGYTAAFTANAISYWAVIFAIAAAQVPRIKLDQAQSHVSLSEAWNWVNGNRGPRRLVYGLAIFAVVSAPLQGLFPFFASDVFHVGPKGLGALVASLGAGAVVGAFLFGQLPVYYPRHHLIPLSMISFSLMMIGYSQAPSLLPGCIFVFVGGVFLLWVFISSSTAMQILVPDVIRGRTMSILILAHLGLLPLGHLLGGLLGQSIGPRPTVLIMNASLMYVGIRFLQDRVPEIDGYPRGESKPIRLRTFFSEVVLAKNHRPTVQPKA